MFKKILKKMFYKEFSEEIQREIKTKNHLKNLHKHQNIENWDAIHCPDCGGGNTHTVETIKIFGIDDYNFQVEDYDDLKYSGIKDCIQRQREDGFVVIMSCEHCVKEFALMLGFHKGTTFIEKIGGLDE